MDKQNNRISIAQAASELSMDPATVRWMIIQGELPIGRYVKRKGSKRGMFLIYRDLLDKELGRKG